MRYLIPLFDRQINGKLCVGGGKIMLILPNYTRIYPEADGFPTKDGTLFVYRIEIPTDLVAQISNKGAIEHFVWKGHKGERTNPLDHVTVPVYSLVPAEASPAPALQQAALKAE